MSSVATYVIRLPEEDEARRSIVQGISDLVKQHGGAITGGSTEDEITLNEMFEKRLGPVEVEEARGEAEALVRQAS